MRIYLIGFMGSGKSRLAKSVAAKTNLTYIDLDERIVAETGKSISDIFNTESENQFRLYEKKALHDTFKEHKAIVACGGGTPCFYDNIEQINTNGVSIYLKVPKGALFKRLAGSKKQRPLISGLTDTALMEFIDALLEERSSCYAKSKLTINALDLSATRLIDYLKENKVYLK